MAKNIHRLTDVEVKNRAIHGNLSDGGGLYLKTRNNGNAKSWLFRWSAYGKRNELTIGSALGANRLSLAQARKDLNPGADRRWFRPQGRTQERGPKNIFRDG
jgi:hypothetical protein